MSSDIVVLRPMVVGAVATASGCLAAAAPLPASAAFAGYVGAALLVRWGWARSRLVRHQFGLANMVTLARLVGSVWILALLLQAVSGEPTPLIAICVAVLGAVCLTLDGVDGRIARSRSETSSFGGRFDIEIDAMTTLLLAITVAVFDVAGWWVVTIGALRYAYLLAGLPLPALRAPLPFSQARRVIGLGQAVLLVMSVLAAGVLPSLAAGGWVALLPGLGLLALSWSFGRDVFGQLRS